MQVVRSAKLGLRTDAEVRAIKRKPPPPSNAAAHARRCRHAECNAVRRPGRTKSRSATGLRTHRIVPPLCRLRNARSPARWSSLLDHAPPAPSRLAGNASDPDSNSRIRPAHGIRRTRTAGLVHDSHLPDRAPDLTRPERIERPRSSSARRPHPLAQEPLRSQLPDDVSCNRCDRRHRSTSRRAQLSALRSRSVEPQRAMARHRLPPASGAVPHDAATLGQRLRQALGSMGPRAPINHNSLRPLVSRTRTDRPRSRDGHGAPDGALLPSRNNLRLTRQHGHDPNRDHAGSPRCNNLLRLSPKPMDRTRPCLGNCRTATRNHLGDRTRKSCAIG